MRYNRKIFIELGVIILILGVIFSCVDKSIKSNNTMNDGSVDNVDEVLKYNGYIDFYNQFLSRNINKDINEYLNQVGEEVVIKKSEKDLSVSAFSWTNIESNIKAKPAMKELDGVAKELLCISKELNELLVSAKNYYNAKDYLDDNYSKGQELHIKILATINKFDEAYVKFNLALREKEIEYQNKEMENAKNEGYIITYNKILVLKLIDNIMNEITTQNLNSSNVLTADLTKIKPLYDDFNRAQKNLRDAYQNEEMLKKENFNRYSSTLIDYIDETTKFKTSILDLIDRIENKKPVEKFRLQNNYMRVIEKGTPEDLSNVRESVVSAYNRAG